MACWDGNSLTPSTADPNLTKFCTKHNLQTSDVTSLCDVVSDYLSKKGSVIISEYSLPVRTCLLEYFLERTVQTTNSLVLLQISGFSSDFLGSLDISLSPFFEKKMEKRKSFDISKGVYLVTSQDYSSLNTNNYEHKNNNILFFISNHTLSPCLMPGVNCAQNLILCPKLFQNISDCPFAYTHIHKDDLGLVVDECNLSGVQFYGSIRHNPTPRVETESHQLIEEFERREISDPKNIQVENTSQGKLNPLHSTPSLNRSLCFLSNKFSCDLDLAMNLCSVVLSIIENGQSLIVDNFNENILACLCEYVVANVSGEDCQQIYIRFTNLGSLESEILKSEIENKTVIKLKTLMPLERNCFFIQFFISSDFLNSILPEIGCQVLGLARADLTSFCSPEFITKPFVNIRHIQDGEFSINCYNGCYFMSVEKNLQTKNEIAELPPIDEMFLNKQNPMKLLINNLCTKHNIPQLSVSNSDIYVTLFTLLLESRNLVIGGYDVTVISPILHLFALECQNSRNVCLFNDSKTDYVPISKIISNEDLQNTPENNNIYILLSVNNKFLFEIHHFLSKCHQFVFVLSENCVLEGIQLTFTHVYKSMEAVCIREYNHIENICTQEVEDTSLSDIENLNKVPMIQDDAVPSLTGTYNEDTLQDQMSDNSFYSIENASESNSDIKENEIESTLEIVENEFVKSKNVIEELDVSSDKSIFPEITREVQEISNENDVKINAESDKIPGISPENSEISLENSEIPPQNSEISPEIIEMPTEMTKMPTENTEISSENGEIPPEITEIPTEITEMSFENSEMPTVNSEIPPENIEISPENTEISPEITEIPTEIIEMPTENSQIPPENTEISPENIEISPENTEISPEITEIPPEITENIRDPMVEVGEFEDISKSDGYIVPEHKVKIILSSLDAFEAEYSNETTFLSEKTDISKPENPSKATSDEEYQSCDSDIQSEQQLINITNANKQLSDSNKPEISHGPVPQKLHESLSDTQENIFIDQIRSTKKLASIVNSKVIKNYQDTGLELVLSPLHSGLHTILHSSRESFYDPIIQHIGNVFDSSIDKLQIVLTSSSDKVCSRLFKLVSVKLSSLDHGFLYKTGSIEKLSNFISEKKVQILSIPLSPLNSLIQKRIFMFIPSLLVYVEDPTAKNMDHGQVLLNSAKQFIFLLQNTTISHNQFPKPFCEIKSSPMNESFSVEFVTD